MPIAKPRQEAITKARVQEMITWRPRRMKLSVEWPESLHEPASSDDWSLVLPFTETLGNAFESMCDVPHIGIRKSKDGRGYTFLKNVETNPDMLEKVQDWLKLIGQYIANRDCLALSFALDYDREDGNPAKPQTEIGMLRTRAKPYSGNPTEDTYAAANDISSLCRAFLEEMTCYSSATCVVAMPSSSPDKAYDLPSYLAAKIAE
ncbi:MAG: hypothetical protein HZA01_05140 [Nitrospinae bacterium]|nr:hypothetical protein [Nitrospinota bacterium]